MHLHQEAVLLKLRLGPQRQLVACIRAGAMFAGGVGSEGRPISLGCRNASKTRLPLECSLRGRGQVALSPLELHGDGDCNHPHHNERGEEETYAVACEATSAVRSASSGLGLKILRITTEPS